MDVAAARVRLVAVNMKALPGKGTKSVVFAHLYLSMMGATKTKDSSD